MSTLMPHQEVAVPFLAERGFAFLWDEPGLGKTIDAIAAADAVGARKILVVCPAVVRTHWADEFETWQRIRATRRDQRGVCFPAAGRRRHHRFARVPRGRAA